MLTLVDNTIKFRLQIKRHLEKGNMDPALFEKMIGLPPYRNDLAKLE
ncbi:MAG: hypothetical protein FWG02_11640 [Holophagaceae bacterium]|nr:hypothetical protein [Holophagaceae bacterium]